jgi:cobalt/nickel transport system permease protein
MHIPDGYLSPSSCAVLYAVAAGGWRVALKRVRARLLTRTVPLISVFAAFSFVLMMFNLPLPGGTTGHAVGAAVAAIVLGPSGAILAISMALALQALLFGDGGLTTLGANCVNMAMVGSLVAYGTYRLLSGSSTRNARRRVFAAAISGYLSINAAALLAATEFGLQPLLFHDARGVPLYAPYRLGIAIPAMMLGHLTLAGLAEAIIAGGMVAYLQSAKPELLDRSLPAGDSPPLPAQGTAAALSLRSLWFVTALLMMLTPMGIWAAGTAWGEWSPAELARHAGLRQGVPAGLQRLTALWTAPFPAYAPGFVKSAFVGYLLSAVFGVGLILMLSLLSSWRSRRLASREPQP